MCWQLPLRREDEVADDGHVTSVIRQWDRRDWGEGGAEFHWWCTESPEAFVGTRPVYEELEPEIVALVGKKIYKRLVRYLQARAGRWASPPWRRRWRPTRHRAHRSRSAPPATGPARTGLADDAGRRFDCPTPPSGAGAR